MMSNHKKKNKIPGPTPISVIVITHNESANIQGCLDSLENQDYPRDGFEIIVVDSSTDSTPDIVTSGYPRVHLIRTEKGFSQQKNAGLAAASFDIVAFTDADCIVPPSWLGAVERAMRDGRIDAIGGDALPPPGTRGFALYAACVGHPAGGAVGFESNVRRDSRGIDFIAGCNAAFRKKILEDAGGFGPEFRDGGEDVDLSRRLRSRGIILHYAPEATLFHKPRATLREFVRWNIQVGITKYNLLRPSLFRLVFHPAFPVWPPAIAGGLLLLSPFPTATLLLLLLPLSWAAYLNVLYFLARPYSSLIRRRKAIGVGLPAVLSIVPVLIGIRQLAIHFGQFRQRGRLRKAQPGLTRS